MLRLQVIILFLFQFGLCLSAETQEKSSVEPSSTRLDYVAIQNSIAGYLQAINDRNPRQAASYWSTNGQWIAEDGSRFQGPAAIASELAKSFAAEPEGMEISLRDLTIRFVTPNVAMEDGVAVISVPNADPIESSYAVVHIKTVDGWKIDSIRETQTPISPARTSQLESLSWLVGDWVDQSDGDLLVESSCDWTSGNKSLRRSFRISENGNVQLQGTQVIIWDARLGTIRSWAFDSDGGFGTGIWQQNDKNQWTVESSYQFADGGVQTSLNVYSKVGESAFEFQSINRSIDGVRLSDTPVVNVVRPNE